MSSNLQDQVNKMNKQGFMLFKQDRCEEAVEILNQAVEVARIAYNRVDDGYIQSIFFLGYVYDQMGNFSAAEPLFKEVLAIRRDKFGAMHPKLAADLTRLGVLYIETGEYTKAEPLMKQALEIDKQVLGEDHPEIVTSLDNLAELYVEMGEYQQAEQLFKRELEVKQKSIGENDPEYATTLDDLAGAQKAMGHYQQAEQNYRKSLDIRRDILGEEDIDYTSSLNNLGTLYYEKGDYSQAEQLFHEALGIRRETLDEQDPLLATSLGNLSMLYSKMGDYAAAEPLCRQALEINRKAFGEDDPRYATSLNNMAGIKMETEGRLSAFPLLMQTLKINRKNLGEEHPDYINILNNEATWFLYIGMFDKALPLFNQALTAQEERLGNNHPLVAKIMNNLGAVYMRIGDYQAAEQMLRQALDIFRKTLGDQHPEVSGVLNNLSLVCFKIQRKDEGLALMKQAADIDNKLIGQIFTIGTEEQRMAHLESIQASFNGFLSLIIQNLSNSPDAVAAAYELVLQRKAIGAEALAAQRDAVMGGQYPQLKSKLELHTDLRRQIAQKTLAGPGEEDAQEHLKILEEWKRKKEQLEAELAQEIPEMNLEQKLRKIDLAAVSQVLPQQHVLVEFVRFTLENFDIDMDRKGSSPLHYLAFVVHASKPETMQMIDLGEAEPIDELISQLRSYITQPPSNGDGRGLGRIPVDEPHDKWEMIGDQLRRLLFDPLVDALQRCSNIMLAPDGDLTRLPFEILPTFRGRLLIDDYHISYLSTGRDILRIGVETAVQPGESLVIADPDYDLGSDVPQEYVASLEHQSRDLRSADIHFPRLPKSRLEGQRIGKMLDTHPWLAENVLEEHLKNCRSPRILHMATHGFFLTDQQQEKSPMNRGLGSVSLPDEAEFTRLGASNLENPLLRSGLALAGAQTWLNKGDLPKAAEDGILTAEDVSGLDLLATELVVLSACETGLGEIRTSEGVFGLRRAFVLAGAKTLVMSLWSVPDDQTQELMEEFYLRLLGGQSRAEALREAQLLIRESYPDPYYWGAFICQGDPGPLSGESDWIGPDIQSAEPGDKKRAEIGKEYIRKGKSLFNAGDFEGALDNFNRGLALQPADTELLIRKTSILLNLNRFSEALETIDKALNLDQAKGSDLGNMYAIKGHALVGIGKHEEALRFYRKCLNLLPDSSIGWYMQGAVLYGLGQREDAIKSLEHARDLEDSIETNLHISYCYMDLEEYSKAAQNYRSMLDKGWTNPFIFHGLGLALIKLNETEEACQWLQRFVDNAGDEHQHLVSQVEQILEHFS